MRSCIIILSRKIYISVGQNLLESFKIILTTPTVILCFLTTKVSHIPKPIKCLTSTLSKYLYKVHLTKATEVIKISIYLYTLAVCPSLGGNQQHKEITKTMGVLLRSSSNEGGSSLVWMALLEYHSPPSPVFHNLLRFTMQSPLLPLPQGCLYKATPWQQQMPIRTASQSLATHSYS